MFHIGIATIQNVFNSFHLGFTKLGGIKFQSRGRLMTTDRDRNSGQLPAEGDGFGAVIDCCISLLRRSSLAAVDDMKLVAVRFALAVVTKNGTIAQTKGGTRLLTNFDAFADAGRTVALCKFIGIGVGFDGTAKFLSGD